MESRFPARIRIGEWTLDREAGEVSRGDETIRLEVRAARLLAHLAEHTGEVVSIDDLLKIVWAGVTVSPDSVYQAVASLRRQLGDDPKHPAYIATVPRLGYRMVAAVGAADSVAKNEVPRKGRSWILWAGAAAALCSAVVLLFWLIARNRGATAPQREKSIAVLPLLDLTEKMSHEIFADGMTEEIIDRLTAIPGCRVAAPRTSFQLKGKKMPIAEVAKTLHVSYVLDGSIRKIGYTMRVAARLVQAGNGYVVWSKSYERPWEESVAVQKEIAEQVMEAVRTSFTESH